jgi:ribonuclease HI
MLWRRGSFDGNVVWVGVDDAGRARVDDGRVPIRYKRDPGAKVYRAGASRVQLDPGAAPEDLAPGTSAEKAAKKASRGSGFGSANDRTAAQAEAAATDARTFLASLPPGTPIAWTDGAAKGNPGRAGSGASLTIGDRRGEASRSLGVATNNVAELTAVEMALDLLDEADVDPASRAIVLMDSKYAHGVLSLGWKVNANAALVARIKDRLARRPGVVLRWVAGHVGVEGNERADALANEGVTGVTRVRWK